MEDMVQTSPPRKDEGGASFIRSAMEWVETIVMAVVFVTVVFTFVVRVITVDGSSMEPTYYHGDRVLSTALTGAPRPGDVVIVVNALDEPIIKRVIATGGQVVEFDQELGEVMVDGEVVPGSVYGIEDGITFVADRPGQMLTFPQIVPEGCLFVLGDNRDGSLDSRSVEVGMVDARNVLGKVFFNLFPISKFGFV